MAQGQVAPNASRQGPQHRTAATAVIAQKQLSKGEHLGIGERDNKLIRSKPRRQKENKHLEVFCSVNIFLFLGSVQWEGKEMYFSTRL